MASKFFNNSDRNSDQKTTWLRLMSNNWINPLIWNTFLSTLKICLKYKIFKKGLLRGLKYPPCWNLKVHSIWLLRLSFSTWGLLAWPLQISLKRSVKLLIWFDAAAAKGSLISESFSFWVKSPKKVPIHSLEYYPPKRKTGLGCDSAPFLGDWSQIKKKIWD